MSFAARKWGSSILLVWLCCAAGAGSVHALEPSRSGTLTLTPPAAQVSIAAVAEAMCDPRGDLSLEAAQGATYVAVQNHSLTTDQCRGYWIRFNLRIAGVPPGGWGLEVSRGWWYAQLYFAHDGGISVLKTGTALLPAERALASSNVFLPLPIDSRGEVTVYLHLVGDTTLPGEARSIDATIQGLDSWLLWQRTALYGHGVYAGIILALVLYNLILYFAIRERTYLYYSLYVFLFGCLWIARSGFFYQYLWPHHPYWESEYQPYLAAAAIIFSILFVRGFLATRRHSRTIDRLLLATIGLTLTLCLARLAGVHLMLPVALSLVALAMTIFFAAVALAALLRGFRPARFFLVAWTALLVGSVIYIFMLLRFLPVNFLTYNAAQIGSAMECILLAFALADRVNLLKRETDEAQSQYTRELQQEVEQRTGELSTAVEKLKAASVTDPLTGLSNRRHVDAAIQPWIAELRRERIRNLAGVPRRYLAICLADLDHFKLINDDLGHAVGDRVLQSAADTLRQNVRATAILSRWGGEEFLILDHVTRPEEDLLMAERLRRSITDDCPRIIVETGRPLSLSLGVVRYPFSDAFPELLDWGQCLALADHALYRAKRAGRNRWRCYRPNEDAVRSTIQTRGAEEVRRLLRVHADEAFTLGLIDVVGQITSDVEVS